MLLRALAKRLLFLGSVNARKPDFVLLAFGVEHGYGVTIRNTNNDAYQGF